MRPLSVIARRLPVPAIVLGAAGLSAFYARQATHWAVMTDELQTSKLATSIAETLSPLPRIHDEHYGAVSQLYPLLLSPFFGFLSQPSAIDAAHVLNALLLASAAWPAYLLARELTDSRLAGCVAAALTAFTPWLVLSSTLLTENAAYPAFVWAVLLAHRAVAAPGPGSDAAALAGVTLAYFARTQLIVLALALPVALLVHEVAYAVAAAGGGDRVRAVRDGALKAVRSHPVLVAAYGAAGAAALAVAAAGELDRLLGNYAETLRGDVFPNGIWRAAAVHLEHVVVGVGVVPFLVAGAWALATIIRPQRKETHAFALLLLVLIPVVTFEASSFDLRFTPGAFTQDRYVVYLVPLLAVGTAAGLAEQGGRLLRAVLVLTLAGASSALAAATSFSGVIAIFWAAPAAAFHGAIADAGGWLGLSADWLVRLATLGLGAAVAAAIWRASSVSALLAAGAAVALFGAFEAGYVFERSAVPATTRPRTLPIVQRDWIDDALPGSPTVALVPNPYLGPPFWWEAEFWNRSADRVLRIDDGPTFTPFPADRLSINFATGEVRGSQPTDLLVLAAVETRVHLAGAAVLRSAPPLVLVRAPRPFRADWAARGGDRDGWTRPGRPVRIHLFPSGVPGSRVVAFTLGAPSETARPLEFLLRAGRLTRRGSVAAGQVSTVRLVVCIPASGFGEAVLVSRRGVRIPDGRVVGVHLDALRLGPRTRGC